MKICVLGASGNTGSKIVRMGLQRGHRVTAVLRKPAKLGISHNLLAVRTAPLLDWRALAVVFEGHDVVINTAGYVTDGPVYLKLFESVIAAAESTLKQDGRLWLFGGVALLDVPGTDIKTLDLPGVPKVYEAHRRNFDRVRATALDWSMLCPGPMIASPDGKPTPDLIVSQEVWPVSRPACTLALPRIATSIAFKSAIPRMTIYYEDAAKVVLDHLERNGPLSRKRVGIALLDGRRHKSAEQIPSGLRSPLRNDGDAQRALQ